ncbi:MAG: VWA domain-containing protein [Bacteroidia bacterium]|nr:VWA domain-containing protein [Bacteroidia bacterium]
MYKFENPIFFYALALIPICVGIYIWYIYRTKRNLKKLGDFNLVLQLMPEVSKAKRNIKFVLLMLSFLFLILAICNLQTGSKLQNVKREGSDIMICLDVSNSMMAQDLIPNRLERAKMAIESMVNKMQGDRLGIVVFAGQAYVQLPITTDYNAAKLFLQSINPKIVPIQGTNIADAIEKASESFGKDDGKNKAIVIITDGENNEEANQSAIDAAQEVSKNNIVIHTIGVGSEAGVPIPNIVDGIITGYKKDNTGNTVITKLDAKILQDIASSANGIYVQAGKTDIGLDKILDKMEELDKKQLESKMYSDYEDQFQWFIGASLLFLIIESLLSERVSKLWKKLNLFRDAKA